MAEYLVIITEPPYGSQKTYNGLRFGNGLLQAGNKVTVWLMQDAVFTAKKGQQPQLVFGQTWVSYQKFVEDVVKAGGEVVVCGSCAQARGLTEGELLAKIRFGTEPELIERSTRSAQTTVW